MNHLRWFTWNVKTFSLENKKIKCRLLPILLGALKTKYCLTPCHTSPFEQVSLTSCWCIWKSKKKQKKNAAWVAKTVWVAFSGVWSWYVLFAWPNLVLILWVNTIKNTQTKRKFLEGYFNYKVFIIAFKKIHDKKAVKKYLKVNVGNVPLLHMETIKSPQPLLHMETIKSPQTCPFPQTNLQPFFVQ